VVVRDQQADEGQGDDVEEGDAPKDLLDGGGEGLARVLRLGRGEPDKFGAGEGEGRGDEDGAYAFETVVEGAGVVPKATTDVAVIGEAANVDDDAEEAGGVPLVAVAGGECSDLHEGDDGSDFDDGKDKLGFAVPLDAE
jgi:hypothetical protein